MPAPLLPLISLLRIRFSRRQAGIFARGQECQSALAQMPVDCSPGKEKDQWRKGGEVGFCHCRGHCHRSPSSEEQLAGSCDDRPYSGGNWFQYEPAHRQQALAGLFRVVVVVPEESCSLPPLFPCSFPLGSMRLSSPTAFPNRG